MSWINYDDVRRQLEAAGLILDKDLTFDARFQRWKVEGEDAERRGWSRLREWVSTAGNVYVVGVYGIWHGNDDGRRKIDLPARDDKARPALSDDDVAAIRAAQKEAQRKVEEERRLEAKTAARWAAQVWAHCVPAPEEHEYLARKRIRPHGTRVLASIDGLRLPGIDDSNWWRLTKSVGALVVPMHNEHGNVCGIQFVYPRGHELRKDGRDKSFWPGGMATGGTFGLIGPLRRSGVMLIAEGFATAASLFEATGITVAYAFSAGNLVKAGRQLRKTCRAARLLFCADDDYQSEGNPGVTAASRASAEIEQSAWTQPDFAGEDGADLRGGKKLTDYNDLAILTGLPITIAAQINAKLDALGWRDGGATPASGALPPTSGDGEGGDGRNQARSIMSVDEVVARFVPLDDGTGKYVFDTWTNKVAHRDQMIALLPAGMRADDIKRHPIWIERGAYYLTQVGFDPGGTDAAVKLNTWRGWPMKAKDGGSCERLLELLHILCGEDPKSEEIARYLLCWMAYPLQNPGAKMHSAVIMHGPQGTGKTTLFQAYAQIYGDYATVLNQRGIEDKFNADWADSKLFILAEEVVTRAEMYHIKNELKELVTGATIRVRAMHMTAYYQKNHINIVYLSNENQPLPLENDDRRHLVIWTPPEMSADFYDEVHKEIEAGGVAAFYRYLLDLDLTGFHPKKRPPMTEAKGNLIALSSPSDIRFAFEWLSGELGLPICPAAVMDVYATYLRWCRANGESRPRPSNHFTGSLARQPGWERLQVRVYPTMLAEKTVPRRLLIPPLRHLQEAGTAPPDGESLTKWYSKSVETFAEAARKFSDTGKVDQWTEKTGTSG